VASEEDAARTVSQQGAYGVVISLGEEPVRRGSYDVRVISSSVLALRPQPRLPGRGISAQVVLYPGFVRRFMVDRG
jgi:hypothetical protein